MALFGFCSCGSMPLSTLPSKPAFLLAQRWGVKGPRLSQLSPDDGKVVSGDIFESYFQMIYRCKMFTSTMAPFASQNYGHEWFRKPFLNLSRQEENDIHDTLLTYLNPTALWTSLTSSKSGLREATYQPNLLARQFYLSQLLPKI